MATTDEEPSWQYLPSAPPPPAGESLWAAWRKPRHAFTCYGLKDGTGWVMFPHKDGRYVMSPYPTDVKGWDEAMPARIAYPAPDLPVYILPDMLAAMVFLGHHGSHDQNGIQPVRGAVLALANVQLTCAPRRTPVAAKALTR